MTAHGTVRLLSLVFLFVLTFLGRTATWPLWYYAVLALGVTAYIKVVMALVSRP